MAQKLVWTPLPGSQELAMTAPVSHILHEGSRGPGKTDGQLMRFRKTVGQGYGAFWRGIIFDKRYKNLDDLVAKSKRWFPQIGQGAKWLSSKSDYKWIWPTGEELLFRHMENESDCDNYLGHEYCFIGWNELTKWPTSACYDKMMSCNRSPFAPAEHSPDPKNPLPEIPLTVYSTTNPHGVGHNWVKRRFIDPAPAGQVVRKTTRVFNPRTQKEQDVVKTQVRLFGSYRENKYLPPEYIADLMGISDPNLREAWLHGNWDITAGGALDDLWKRDVHVLPRFVVPKDWRVTRSFDWGSTHPFSVGFWAIANGEEVEFEDGKTRTFVRGSRIRIDEIYGAKLLAGEQFGHNQGRKLSARKVALEIKERESDLKLMGYIQTTPEPGPADNQISNVNEDETASIASIMAKEGITWTKSDKSAGSRKMGLELVRTALESSLTGEGPGLYVTKNCKAFIETVPTLPRDEDDPEDIATDAEDHCFVAGTLVKTPNGDTPIEQLREGDLVLTRQGFKPVTKTHKTKPVPVFRVETGAGQLVGTGNHPIFVEGQGWKRIDLLMKGDSLRTAASNPTCVTDVKPAGFEAVYNITVSDCHEYFANGFLVHNCYDETRYLILDAKPVFANSVKVKFAMGG